MGKIKFNANASFSVTVGCPENSHDTAVQPDCILKLDVPRKEEIAAVVERQNDIADWIDDARHGKGEGGKRPMDDMPYRGSRDVMLKDIDRFLDDVKECCAKYLYRHNTSEMRAMLTAELQTLSDEFLDTDKYSINYTI